MFVDGLETLNRTQLTDLVSTLEVFSVHNQLREQASKLYEQLRNRFEWLPQAQAYRLIEHLRKRREELADLSESALRTMLFQRAGRLCRCDGLDRMSLYRRAIAEACKCYRLEMQGKDLDELEETITRRYLEDLERVVKQAVRQANQQQAGQIVDHLEETIKRANEQDQELMRRAAGLDHLSGRALWEAVRKGALGVGAVSALNATGFGAFLALTTVLHAIFTTTLGIVLPFALYTSATAALGALLGPFGILLAGGGVPAVVLRKGDRQSKQRLLAMLIARGRLTQSVG